MTCVTLMLPVGATAAGVAVTDCIARSASTTLRFPAVSNALLPSSASRTPLPGSTITRIRCGPEAALGIVSPWPSITVPPAGIDGSGGLEPRGTSGRIGVPTALTGTKANPTANGPEGAPPWFLSVYVTLRLPPATIAAGTVAAVGTMSGPTTIGVVL